MKKNISTNIANQFHRTGFKLRKHSPLILTVAGTAGVVASGVMACKASTKLNTILEESKKEVELHEKYVEDNGFTEKYSEKDYKNDLRILYLRRGVNVVKLYAPSVALGMLSLSAIISSHRILQKRNVALAAAYATLDKSFKGYRSRVVEKFGDTVESQLRYGTKQEEIEEVVVDEKGEEKKKKTIVDRYDPNAFSDYARFWGQLENGETSPGWDPNPEYRLMYIKGQQKAANEQLKRVGHLFLNDVYTMLGYPKTIAGQSVGWIYDEKHPHGDNYVDFGVFNKNSEQACRFVNGLDSSVFLDFNVDGPIIDEVGFQYV